MIYLDHNATTPLDARVLDAMQPYLTTFYGNPSSLHRHGRTARTAIENAREQVARLVNVSASQVIFTSGGTEANNIAVLGSEKSSKNHVLIGATEHPSVIEPAAKLQKQGVQIETIAVDTDGQINTERLKAQICEHTSFISLMHANNETGVIQDLSKVAELASSKGVILHTDAVQSAGKVELDFSSLKANLMSLSGHKLYGPKGVGALIVDNKTGVNPLAMGGAQEAKIRPGTENVAGIVGFGVAAELAKSELASRSEHLSTLRSSLESKLDKIDGLTVVAKPVERLPNTSQIIVENLDGEMLLMLLDKSSIAVSSGSACASRNTAPSPVLMAMGYTEQQANSALRISLGKDNSEADIEKFSSLLTELVESNR
ncbi:MAG: cysteine desulfurase [Cycloclasticus sp. symbiont of Poecilosclerida sp. M]|nr:MAG: cysteine desulfurase [Cycloclasticus sp. symbiont of Poecilosclerida sp. M]